jgi:hypothetical protein
MASGRSVRLRAALKRKKLRERLRKSGQTVKKAGGRLKVKSKNAVTFRPR